MLRPSRWLEQKSVQGINPTYVFARTGQDLKVALSEFQPGKRLTINKQSFLVRALECRSKLRSIMKNRLSLKNNDTIP